MGIEDHLLPHSLSQNNEANIEEERRLFYVAMTRAKNNLFLSFCKNRLIKNYTTNSQISRFLLEIPEKYLYAVNDNSNYSYYNKKNHDKNYGNITSNSYNNALFKIGDKVSHQNFGFGKVIQTEGGGDNFRVKVDFQQFGIKHLIVQYANLEKV